MKVLQVITDTDRRGAQVFAVDLGDALGRRGHDVRTVALRAGQRLRRLDVPVLGSTRLAPSMLRSLRREMAQVDVTVAHGSSTLLACALAGIGRGRPFVYRQISDSRFWASTMVRRVRVAAYLRAPVRIVALSESARVVLSSYFRIPRRKIDVVPNGVPRASFLPATSEERKESRVVLGLPLDARIALFIGALAPEKGCDVAIHAAAQLEDVHLGIVGDGPELEHLRSLTPAQARHRVHFIGELTDVLPAYHAADLVLLPSRGGDSMPATLIEAAFCALPSISTPVGSIDEIVVDGVTGYLTAPGDVSALGAAMGRLLGDENLRRRMGSVAERHCSELFDIDAVAALWDATLTAAAQKSPK